MVDMVVVPRSPQLPATTTPAGVNWMTCNQLDMAIEQSSMAIKFMSLEGISHGKSEVQTLNNLKLLEDLYHYVF